MDMISETSPLSELRLRARSHNALLALGITTVGGVTRMTRRGLESADGVGKAIALETADALHCIGLSFSPDQPINYWTNRKRKWTPEMVAELVAYRQEHTLRECGEKFGCTPERARQVMGREARRVFRSGMGWKEAFKSVRINLA